MHKVAPSILSADFSKLGEEVQALEKAGADRFHIDIMDGHFVPNLTIGPPVVKSLKKFCSLPLDVHLMVEKPENIIPALISAGADSITIHVEASKNPLKILNQIRDQNIQAGITLKPQTPIETLFPLLSSVDLVLIMTVEPGFGGQTLLKSQVPKIEQVKKELVRQGLVHVSVQVDGGVNAKTLPLLSFADVLVAGHFIFKYDNYKEAISLLKKRA